MSLWSLHCLTIHQLPETFRSLARDTDTHGSRFSHTEPVPTSRPQDQSLSPFQRHDSLSLSTSFPRDTLGHDLAESPRIFSLVK